MPKPTQVHTTGAATQGGSSISTKTKNSAPGKEIYRPGSVKLASVLLALSLLGLVIFLSLSLGSREMSFTETWSLLIDPDGGTNSTVLHELRVPRTVLGVVVGAALGVAGALMQSLTRNPLAEPGILGVNAGASFAVVFVVVLTGVSGISFYLWFAFVGAALASVLVYTLGSTGGQSATPVRLALAGVAVSAALEALTQTAILGDQAAYNEFRFWVVGSFEGRLYDVIGVVAPFIVVGLVMACLLAPALNALVLGDEAGKALGVNVKRTRILTMVAVTLLCGAATAAVGPIGFVGLAVPFLARNLVGTDQKWITLFCLILGPAWLLGADVLARVLVRPEEVQVGIIAALVGAPIFIAIIRKGRGNIF